MIEPELLATKLHIPARPPRAVHRARLLDILEREIPTRKLTVISAPAGYGKTTLAAQWAHESELPTVWLSLDEEDNDLTRLLRYLVAGWQELQPAVRESRLGVLMEASAPDTQVVLSAIINVAAELTEPIIFVLDDYHLVSDQPIHGALNFLLDHLPAALHLVLIGRGEPPLPLGRYRAHNTMFELRAENLALTADEAREFLRETAQLELSPDRLETLQAQVEGWIAGLQLVALSLRQGLASVEGLTVSGRHRFIADYLSDEVLGRLPGNVREFLLQTSILDRLHGPLCDAVTAASNSQGMLEHLEREGLFLVSLDAERRWFRIHRLFADLLRHELERRHPEQVVDLHRRAARWYLAQDRPEAAFDHAVEAADPALVSTILERYFAAKLLAGEVRIVEKWLRALPEAWHTSYPMIDLARAGILLATGQFDACARHLDRVERRLPPTLSEEMRHKRAMVTALRCNIACYQNNLARAQALADEALAALPEDDVGFRPGVHGALGDTYRRHGRWAEARAHYLKLLDFTHAPAFRVEAAHVYGALADLELRQGHLRAAVAYWEAAMGAIREHRNWGLYPLPVIGWVYARMGEILYEWDELAAAWEHLSRGLERAELGGDVRAMIAARVIAGRIRLSEGDPGEAVRYLDRARPLVESTQFDYWAGRFQRLQIELWLVEGDVRSAVQLAEALLPGDDKGERPAAPTAQLAAVRALIAQGDGHGALAHLDRLRQAAEEQGRMGSLIEALALEALAHRQAGRVSEALTTLEDALRLAEPEGYVRLFADLGLPAGRLLQEARRRGVMPTYVDRLLAAFRSLARTGDSGLPEPLTPREREVLSLMAAGLTNREIATQLIISPGTVKKHAGHIYAKLGVGNRTEAAARARDLNLLD